MKLNSIFAVCLSAMGLVACNSGVAGDIANSTATSTNAGDNTNSSVMLNKSFAAQVYNQKIQKLNQEYNHLNGLMYTDPTTFKQSLLLAYQDVSGAEHVLDKIYTPEPDQMVTAATLDGNETLIIGLSNGDVWKYPDGKSGWSSTSPTQLVDGKNVCVYVNDGGHFTETTHCNLAITSLSTAPNENYSNYSEYIAIGTGVNHLHDSVFHFGFAPSEFFSFFGTTISLNLNFEWDTYDQSVGGQIYYYFNGNTNRGLYWDNSGNNGQSVEQVTAISNDPHSGVFAPYIFAKFAPNSEVSSTSSFSFMVSLPLNPLMPPAPSFMFNASNTGYSKEATDFGVYNMGRATGGSRMSDYLNNAKVSSVMPDFASSRMFVTTSDGTIYSWRWAATIDQGNTSGCTSNWCKLDKSKEISNMQLEGDDLYVGYKDGEMGKYPHAATWNPSLTNAPAYQQIISCGFWSDDRCKEQNWPIVIDFSNQLLAIARGKEFAYSDFDGTVASLKDHKGLAGDGTIISHIKTFAESSPSNHGYLAYSSDNTNQGMVVNVYNVDAKSNLQALPGLNNSDFVGNFFVPVATSTCDTLVGYSSYPHYDITDGSYTDKNHNNIVALQFKKFANGNVFLYATTSALLVEGIRGADYDEEGSGGGFYNAVYQLTPGILRTNLSLPQHNSDWFDRMPMYAGHWYSTTATKDNYGKLADLCHGHTITQPLFQYDGCKNIQWESQSQVLSADCLKSHNDPSLGYSSSTLNFGELCAPHSKVITYEWGSHFGSGVMDCQEYNSSVLPPTANNISYFNVCKVSSYKNGVLKANCYHDPDNRQSDTKYSELDYAHDCGGQGAVSVRKWGDSRGGGAGTLYCVNNPN